MRIVARPLFGYRTALHLIIICAATIAALLLHSLISILLALLVALLMVCLLVVSLTPRLVFTEEMVVYHSASGRITVRWVLDGNAKLDVTTRPVMTRWGGSNRLGTLVLKQSDHYPGAVELVLPLGIYSRQTMWSRLLTRAAEDGQLVASPQALAALVRYGGARPAV